MAQYPCGDGEFDWITGMVFALALAIIAGTIFLFAYCTEQERKLKEQMRPPTLAEKWAEHNKKKYNL